MRARNHEFCFARNRSAQFWFGIRTSKHDESYFGLHRARKSRKRSNVLAATTAVKFEVRSTPSHFELTASSHSPNSFFLACGARHGLITMR